MISRKKPSEHVLDVEVDVSVGADVDHGSLMLIIRASSIE